MQDLPDTVIEVIVEAIGNGHLIQKQARLCDLAALDAIPTAIVRRLKLHHQQAIALSRVTSQRSTKIDSTNNPENLRLLAKNENWYIRIKPAEDPFTPIDVLAALAYDTFDNGSGKYLVRNAAAENPATPVEILEKLSQESHESLRISVARNPSTPAEILEKFSQDSSKPVRGYVARNPSTPIFILEYLAKSFVYSVVRNPSTPSHILKNIASSTYGFDTLERIAKHKNTPTETLTELSTCNLRDGWKNRLLIAVVKNPNTSAKTLEDIYLYSLQKESDNLNSPKESWVKSSTKQQLINIRKAIAENPNSSIYLLDKLEEEMESSILIGLAQNPNLPIHLIRTLAEDYEDINYIQKCLAMNHYMPIEILQKLAQRRNNYIRKAALKSLCQKIGENPAISTRKLREILNYQDPEVRHAVVKHPQGLKVLLDYCLKPERNFPEQNSLHRILTGMYPEISRKKIDDLLNSEDFLDRLAVVCNPNISKDNLEKLTEDENFVVRQTAVQFLLEKQN